MTDSYKIGILLKVTNGASSVLGMVERDFLRTEKAAVRLHAAMKDLRLAAGAGAFAGGMALGLEKALKPAMEYQHQLTLMKNNLNDQKELAKAVGAAWQTSKDVLTSTPTENLKVLSETKFAFGNLDEAVKNLPRFMQMNAILASVLGKDGADEAFSGARLQELRGSVKSDDEFTRQMEAMVRTTQATGGRVGPDQFLAFAKMAAPFTTRFSDQFLYNQAPTMMQDMGAEKAGTALNTLLQTVVGGRMTKASFAMAQNAGLIDKDASYKVGSAGTIQLEKRQWHGADLAQQNPLQWVQQYLMPALSKLPQQDQGLFLTQLFSNRNAQRAANDFLVNDWRYLKDEAQTKAPTGIKAMGSLLQEDPETAQKAAAAQWDKLWTTFGVQIVPKLIPLITKMAQGLDALSGIMARHPMVTQMVAALGIFVTGLAALGTVVALISAPITALGLALGAVAITAAKTWPTISTALEQLWKNIAHWFQTLPGRLLGDPAATGDYRTDRTKQFMADHHMPGAGGWLPADPQYSPASGSPFRAPGKGNIHINLMADGRKLAHIVTDHLGNMLGGQSQGSQLFDSRQAPTPAGP